MLVRNIVANFDIALGKAGKPKVAALRQQVKEACQQIQKGQLRPDDLPSEQVVVLLIDGATVKKARQLLEGVVASPGWSSEDILYAYVAQHGDDIDIRDKEDLDRIRHFLKEGGISPDEVLSQK